MIEIIGDAMKNISFKPWICIAVVLLLACCTGYASAYIEEDKRPNQEILSYLGYNTGTITTNNDVVAVRIINADSYPSLEVAYYVTYYGEKYDDEISFQEDFERHVDVMIEQENSLSEGEEYTLVVVRADAAGTIGDLQLRYIGTWTQKDGFHFYYLEQGNVETKTEDPIPTDTVNETSFGNPITFDDLEISFGDTVTWTAVENQFSDKNGMPVFLVPITVKNVKGETHGLNMFYYAQYGSKGTTLDGVGSYFDKEISYAGKIRPGATLESFMAFLYDGDGDYYVEFSKLFGEKTEVKLPIKR